MTTPSFHFSTGHSVAVGRVTLGNCEESLALDLLLKRHATPHAERS